MLTARDRALSFLQRQLEWIERFDRRAGRGESPERDGRISGALGALEAAGVISRDEAVEWRGSLLEGTAPPRPVPPAETRTAAEALLTELIDAVPPDGDHVCPELNRFEGALGALAAVGAVDAAAWDERLRTRMGRPSDEEEQALHRELNAGGTQEELLAVHLGPSPSPDGVRVLYVLRFSDGVSVVVHREHAASFGDEDDWWDPELTDDTGTTYVPGGSGGGDHEQHFDFRTPTPQDAAWIEVHGVAQDPIRVELR